MDNYEQSPHHDRRIPFCPEDFKLKQYKRNHFFFGKMMTVEDFRLEQDYFNHKRNLINRLIHGGGIVCGLNVTLPIIHEGDDGWRVDISEGCAIDCCGREIVISKRYGCSVICTNPEILKCNEIGLYLREVEYLVDLVPSARAERWEERKERKEERWEERKERWEHECCESHIEEKFELLFDYLPEKQEKRKYTQAELGVTRDSESIKSKIIDLYCKEMLQECPSCHSMKDGGPKVLLAVLCWKDGTLVVEEEKTKSHRKALYSNEMLGDWVTTLLYDVYYTDKFKQPPKSTCGIAEIERDGTEELTAPVYVISQSIVHGLGKLPAILLGKMDTNKNSIDYMGSLAAHGEKIHPGKQSYLPTSLSPCLEKYLSAEEYPVSVNAVEITDTDFKILAIFPAKSKESKVNVKWTAIPIEEQRANVQST
jgi:hypothetical protein